MEDHNGLTRTTLGKVGEEFMHNKVVKELVFSKQTFASLAELDFSNNLLPFVGSWQTSFR